MLLAIDIGNTQVALGVWDGRAWRKQWRLRTIHDQTSDEYGTVLVSLLREAELLTQVTAVILSSVVPALTRTFNQLSNEYLHLEPLIINSTVDTGIVIRTDYPQEVGADRIVNAVAAFHDYPGPSIVIDIGTATTFDVISSAGELLGVAIAPGLGLAADALVARAAQLPQVPLQAPQHAIGRNTVEAMQSGLIFGYAGLVDSMVARLLAEHPDKPHTVTIIGTGGLIGAVAPYTSTIQQVDRSLTLTGLRLIYERVTA